MSEHVSPRSLHGSALIAAIVAHWGDGVARIAVTAGQRGETP
jgi:hypothetical protein